MSPPRQSVIAAAHNAEIGSQIKVKFDTGHWYSGTILKVDPQRCGWFDWLVRLGFVKVLWLCVSAGKVTRLVDANLLPYRSTSCSCVWSRQWRLGGPRNDRSLCLLHTSATLLYRLPHISTARLLTQLAFPLVPGCLPLIIRIVVPRTCVYSVCRYAHKRRYT